MSNSESMYKEFSLFNNIEDPGHRAWNRLMTVSNLKLQDRGRDAAGYLEKLDDSGKASIAILVQAIKAKGYETVRAELNRSIETKELS